MWNENRSNQTVVDRAVGQGVWQESPLVGMTGLLKKHQASASKAFRLVERPFLEQVNLRGDLLRCRLCCRPVEKVIGLQASREAQYNGDGQRLRPDVAWA